MEGNLLFLNNKKKPKQIKCEFIYNRQQPMTSELLMYDEKGKHIEHRIPMFSITRISQYFDQSWELGTNLNEQFNFRAVNNDENTQWFNILNQAFKESGPNQNLNANPTKKDSDTEIKVQTENGLTQAKDKDFQNTQTNPIKEVAEVDIYEMRIIPKLTSKSLLNNFSLQDTYKIAIEPNGISLRNKKRPSTDIHFFSAK
jgi:hypothetical protein